ncbi:MAG: hypothetical protein JWN32_2742, partial [Solirubrobacterales bacterium]|nr:hypothetical protein [Solirubrobacterales bacterium]
MSLLVIGEHGAAPTARLETDLRAPIPLGVFVDARARIVAHDGRKVTVSADLRDEHGALLAEGRGVFVLPAPG